MDFYDFSDYIQINTCCRGDNGKHSDDCPTMFGQPRREAVVEEELDEYPYGMNTEDLIEVMAEEQDDMYNRLNKMEEELSDPAGLVGYKMGYAEGQVAGAANVLEILRLTPAKFQEIKNDIEAGKSVIISTLTVGNAPQTLPSGFYQNHSSAFGFLAGTGKSSASSGSFKGPKGNTDPNEPWDHPADGNPPSKK